MSFQAEERNNSKIRYIELCGLPGVGKTTLVRELSLGREGYRFREPFFSNVNLFKRVYLLVSLSFKYFFLFLSSLTTSFGLNVVLSKQFWRGYFDYITIMYFINSTDQVLLYDQGMVALFLGLASNHKLKKGSVMISLNNLFPRNNTLLVHVTDSQQDVEERFQSRAASSNDSQKINIKELHEVFGRYNEVLDKILSNHSELAVDYEIVDLKTEDYRANIDIINKKLP